jgi:hypothetical protein
MPDLKYPVWRGPILVCCVVVVCFCLWWWWCPCGCPDCNGGGGDCPDCVLQYKEVIIEADCDALPEELDVARGDAVIWTNLRTEPLAIKFKNNVTPFQVLEFWMGPWEQLIMVVKDSAAEQVYDYERHWQDGDGNWHSCETETPGPRVNVSGGDG